MHKRYLQGILFAALVLLIFACGFPFAIKGMEWMVDYFGPLRQFRGLGRFTWAYFYVVNLLAFYIFWNQSVRFKGFGAGRAPWFRWVIALLPLLILGYEAWTFQRLTPINLVDNVEKREVAAPTPESWLNKVDFKPYQAFLSLPYYHMGSENIWWDFDFNEYIRTQTAAVQTGIPDMGVNMSRTSCSQTVASAQFALEPCVVPSMLSMLPDNRPLAVLVDPPNWEDVRRRYRHLIEPATPVFNDAQVKVFSLQPDSVRAYVYRHAQSVEAERNTRSLQPSGIWQLTQPANALIYQSYDSLTTSAHIFQGKGAYAGNMRDTTWLWHDHLPKGQYTISFWIYVNQDLGMNHELKIVENNRKDGHEVHFQHDGMRFYLKSIVNGWGLFELSFEVYDEDAHINAFLRKEAANQPFYLDEVLIKPLNTEVYRRLPGWVVRNNFWYQLEN